MPFDLTKFLKELTEAITEAQEQREQAQKPQPEMVTKDYHDSALRDADRRHREFVEGIERRTRAAIAKLQIALGYNERPENRPFQTLDQVVDEVARELARLRGKTTPEPTATHVFDTPEKKVESYESYREDMERQQRADEATIVRLTRELDKTRELHAAANAAVAELSHIRPEARYEPNNTGRIGWLHEVKRVEGARRGEYVTVTVVFAQGVSQNMSLAAWLKWEVVG